MNYFVKKGEENSGPYTLAELQLQVQLGKIAPTDLAQSEGMTEWAEVSQVLGTVPIPVVTSAVQAPVAEVQTVPLPYNLHWILVLILQAVTRNIFGFIWALYLANWARKLEGDNKPLVLVAMLPAGVIAGAVAATGHSPVIGPLLILAGFVAYVIGIFGIRSAMETYYNSTEKYGLTLSGAMTFFFSIIYFQYHINQISKWKKSLAPASSVGAY